MGSVLAPVSSEVFRAVLRRFATGVAVVTTTHEDRIHGFTANAFASVSAEPPTVLICVNREARAHPLIAASQRFCVNILAADQQALAEQFASGEPQTRFDGVVYHLGPSGSPILAGTLAYLDCRLGEELTSGTHTIFLGNVIEAAERDGPPLGYYNRHYRNFGL